MWFSTHDFSLWWVSNRVNLCDCFHETVMVTCVCLCGVRFVSLFLLYGSLLALLFCFKHNTFPFFHYYSNMCVLIAKPSVNSIKETIFFIHDTISACRDSRYYLNCVPWFLFVFCFWFSKRVAYSDPNQQRSLSLALVLFKAVKICEFREILKKLTK